MRKKLAILGLLGLACYGQTPRIDYVTQLRNQPTFTSDSNSSYTTFAQACNAANTAGATLLVSRTWSAMTTQSITCDVQFLKGGILIVAANQTVTITGAVTAPLVKIFDTSASGSSVTGLKTPQYYPEWWGADGTGVSESRPGIQAAVTAAAAAKSCVFLTGSQYKVTGSISSPALGQLCMRGNYNAVPYTGVVSGISPRSASLVQYQNSAKTVSLAGLSNVVDGLDFTIPTGVTGVTAIYGTDTVSQPFAHNRITNNSIHGYSSGVTQGTHLAAGIDIESIGANANNNTITGNVVEIADTGYILHGASTSAVVNANIFHNWAMVCNDAAILTNAGEMGEFWLSMEGNQRAVTGVGVVASDFYLDNGEQAPPHLMLSGGSHDNTLWSAQRNRNGGQIGMTVSADSTPNALADLSGIWQGISSTGQRFWMFGGVGESSSQTPNLSVVQHTSDTSGSTRSTYRIAHSVNFNSVSDLSYTPQGCDSLGYCGFYHATEASFDYTKPIANFQQFGTQAGNSPYAFMRIGVSGNLLGEWICNSVNTAARFDTACGFRLNARNTASTLVTPFIVRGDGIILYPPTPESAAFLEPCTIDLVGMQKPNYPYATSKTRGAAPSSGGAFNVSIRCSSDDGVTAAWVIQ